MSDGMGREFTYLSSHATNRYFIPNWGIYTIIPRALPYPLYTSLTILNISHLQKKLSSPVLKVVYPGRDWLL